MKRYYILLLLIGTLLSSCDYYEAPGPVGPPGRDGIDGLDGEEAYVFEYEFSFTAPDYSILLNLPDDFTMLDSDVVMVYLLWEIRDGVEIWRALPQTLYLADGLIHYNYDFTKYDAIVFMDGSVNLDVLGADFTDNWIARVVVIPGAFSGGRAGSDFSDYDEVKELLNLSPSKLATEDYLTRPN